MADAPLWEAIKLRNRAKRKKAHPAIIERLEQRVRDEARIIVNLMGKSAFGRQFLKDVQETCQKNEQQSKNSKKHLVLKA